MSKYNLMHCVPNPRMHGLNGYKEVIDTIAWGLERLGHSVHYSLNDFDSSATNIIFGAQVLPIDLLKVLPKNSIVYNFEQMKNGESKNSYIRDEVYFIAKHFDIWDYSNQNLQTWSDIGALSVKIVPVGYAPVLSRISKSSIQDIDVLMYGTSGQDRALAFHKLSNAGFSTVFVSGLYGNARDELIARSKIILNVHLYKSKIFEIVRVSYLLANKKAIIAVIDEESEFDDELISCVKFTTIEELVSTCEHLLDNEAARITFEKSGYDSFSKRDIVEILMNSL